MPRGELADEKRCTATNKSGQRCGATARVGLTVCRLHGGSAPRALAKSERAKAEKVLIVALHKLDPIPETDIEANPMESFLIQYRTTIARIRYIGEKIKQLHDSDENALVWGTTRQEDIGATEFGGVNTTYEAQLNVYVAWEFKERQFAHDMQKTWIAAKLDVRRLEIESATVERLDEAIVTMLKLLGKDPHEPETRQIVREALAIAAKAS